MYEKLKKADVDIKKGFTLAEVLVTLAIIGVVAALTIPLVVINYQKKELYTKFMKSYNNLQTIFQLAYTQKGDINNWVGTYTKDDVFLDVYFKEFLDIAEVCSVEAANCNHTIKPLNYTGEQQTSTQSTPTRAGYILNDGSMILVNPNNIGHNMFYVDTNGKKGPNTQGRDFFTFYFDAEKTGKPLVYPYGLFTRINGGKPFTRSLNEIKTSSDVNSNCSTSVSSKGIGCGARLFIEGKMDY